MRTRTLLPLLLIGLIGAWAGAAWNSSWTVPSRKMTETQAPVPPAQRDEDDAASGCPDAAVFRAETGLAERGPLRLQKIVCVRLRSHGRRALVLSPDGTAVAHWNEGREPGLEVAPLDGSDGFVFPNRTSSVFRTFTSRSAGAGGFAWAGDSRGLWTVRQATAEPSFAIGPLEPIRVGRDGQVEALPALRHPGGWLDGLEWIGGDGLGIAQFGTRGRYYRPDHEDASPTLALVDARRGRVLETIDMLRAPVLAGRLGRFGFHPTDVAGTVLADGRIRAIVQLGPRQDRPVRRPAGTMPEGMGDWLVWTQGEPPRLWRPAPGTANPRRIVLSRDGRRLLVYQGIQPSGIIVEHGPSPPPEPVSGTAAEMLDVATGRSLWRIEARAAQRWTSPDTPAAFSPNGELILFALPPVEGHKAIFVLADARSGRILQRLQPLPDGRSAQTFGFGGDGRRVWFASGDVLFFYRLGGR